MQFQLAYLLYIYLAFVFIWLIFNLVVIYHMLKYGLKSMTTYITTFSFIAVSLLIIYFSYLFISPINWGGDMRMIDDMIQPIQDLGI